MSTSPFIQYVRAGWQAIYHSVDTTILSDIRANRLRLSGLRGESQILAVVSVVFVISGIVLMLLSTQIRQWFPLFALPSGDHVNGTLIPLPVIGIIVFAIGLAWSLLLYASTSMSRWIRIVLVLAHGSLMILWLIPLATMNITSALVAFVALIVVSVMGIRHNNHDQAWPWVVVFIAEVVMLGITHWQYLELFQQSGVNMLLVGVSLMMQENSVLVIPMMFYVGINMTRAAVSFGQWGRIATSNASLQQMIIGAIFMVLLRLLQIPDLRPPTQSELIAIAAYVGVIAVVAGVLYRISHHPQDIRIDDILVKFAPWLVVTSIFPVVVFTLINFTVGGANMLTGGSNQTVLGWWEALSNNSTTVTTTLGIAVTAGFGVVAGHFWRKQHYITALYFALLCALHVSSFIYDIVHLTLRMHVADTVLFVICAVYLTFQLQYPEQRTLRIGQLLSLSVVSYFMQQLDFLNNPLSPVFSYAGIFFVGFGFVWDTLVGAGWVNEASPQFPRHARLFGYLGYTLLTITLVMWAGFSLNPDLLALMSGQHAVEGVYTYGFPAVHLLYLVIILAPEMAFHTLQPADTTQSAILPESSPH